MKAMIIVVTGIPGSGKTTVLNEVVKVHSEVQIINYGDAMLQEATLQKINRDALRKMPISAQQDIGLSAAKKIAKQAAGIVFVDTHALIKTPMGYMPGIPHKVIQTLNPRAIVAIESSPEAIIVRRIKDTSRNRDEEIAEQIEYHQFLNRAFIAAVSAMTGALIIPINNMDKPSKSAKPLIHAIASFQNEMREKVNG